MSAACRVGWHAWGRWKFTRVRHTAFGATVSIGEGQYRSCRKCGREQVRA